MWFFFAICPRDILILFLKNLYILRTWFLGAVRIVIFWMNWWLLSIPLLPVSQIQTLAWFFRIVNKIIVFNCIIRRIKRNTYACLLCTLIVNSRKKNFLIVLENVWNVEKNHLQPWFFVFVSELRYPRKVVESSFLC